ELDGASIDVFHQLRKGLGSVRFRVATAQRAEVRAEQVQRVHPGAPISIKISRSSSSVTPSTTVGRPTSSSNTNRTPLRNFLSIRNADRMSRAGGSGPLTSRPTDVSRRAVRAVSPSGARPLDSE